jgi:hypothetical protein
MWLFVTAFVYLLKGPKANCSATPQSLHVNFLQLLEKNQRMFGFWNVKMEPKMSAEKSVIIYKSISRQIPEEPQRDAQMLRRLNANKKFKTPRDRTEILFIDKKSPLIFLPPGLIKKFFRTFPNFLNNQESFQGQQEARGHAVTKAELRYFI